MTTPLIAERRKNADEVYLQSARAARSTGGFTGYTAADPNESLGRVRLQKQKSVGCVPVVEEGVGLCFGPDTLAEARNRGYTLATAGKTRRHRKPRA